MFEGAKLKANWAHMMIRDIERLAHEFSSTQTRKVWTEHNRETGDLRVWVESVSTPVPPAITLLTGTCVQTLHACFDYLTSEIRNADKGLDTRLHFPNDVDDDQLVAGGAYKKLYGVRPELAEFIRKEIKPTKDGNYPIWALKRLANTDKHRNLLLASIWDGVLIDELERTDSLEMGKVRFMRPSGSDDDDSAFTIPNVAKHSEPQALIYIRLDEPNIARPDFDDRLEIIGTLSDFLKVTTETINAVEQFLTPEA